MVSQACTEYKLTQRCSEHSDNKRYEALTNVRREFSDCRIWKIHTSGGLNKHHTIINKMKL